MSLQIGVENGGFTFGFGSMAEPHKIAAAERARTREAQLQEVQAQMGRIKEEIDRLTPALNGWDDLNNSLAPLAPPHEVATAFAMVGVWIETYHGATLAELRTWEDQESDLLF